MNQTIELSDKQSVAFNLLEDKETNEILYGGGAGGGKSMLGCIWHIYRRTKYPNSRGLIGRAKIANLEQSTLVTLFKVAGLMGYKQGTHYTYNSQKHTINWSNGSQTILKDLFLYPSDPDFTSLGSTEYTDAFIDEATEVTLKAFEIVSTRIRWNLDKYGIVPKLLITANPSDGWVKERFIEKDGEVITLEPHQKFIQSLVSENPDKTFKELYIKQLERITSDYDKQRLLYGDWSASRDVQSPFATQWDDKKHIGICQYEVQRQLIISVDFNLVPFCATFHHYYFENGKQHWTTFDEAEIKQGSIPAMIDLIKTRYKASLPNAIITGDAMGNRGDISQRDNASLYLQLIRGLGMNERQIKVSNNPTHENSRADVNYVLYNLENYKVNPKCTGTIRDWRNVQVDATGSIIKGNRKDINQRGDFIDTNRYFVHNIMYQWIEQHQKHNRF